MSNSILTKDILFHNQVDKMSEEQKFKYSAMLKINQVAVEDTTTDTTNDLTTVPRFDGENNISVKSDAKTNTATLNVWDMTEQECTDKLTVRTNAAWIKNLNIKYVKKDK